MNGQLLTCFGGPFHLAIYSLPLGKDLLILPMGNFPPNTTDVLKYRHRLPEFGTYRRVGQVIKDSNGVVVKAMDILVFQGYELTNADKVCITRMLRVV